MHDNSSVTLKQSDASCSPNTQGDASMTLKLHKNATTTLKIRKEIQESPLSLQALCRKYNLSVTTVRRWKSRDTVADRPHTAHNLQTTLSPSQEEIVVAIRQMLWISLDDLLAIIHEFIHPTMLRSSLHRLLKRRGVSRKPAKETQVNHKKIKSYGPGYVHIYIKNLPMMSGEKTRRYLFIALDRTTRWVFIKAYKNKSVSNTRKFLAALHKATPLYLRVILTDNGKEFTDRFVTTGEKTPTGRDAFDQLCQELAIEHRLTKSKRDSNSDTTQRFDSKLSAIFLTDRFKAEEEEVEQTIYRYARLYNTQFPQKGLGYKSPVDAVKEWQASMPELFRGTSYNHQGQDISKPKELSSASEVKANANKNPSGMKTYINNLFRKKT